MRPFFSFQLSVFSYQLDCFANARNDDAQNLAEQKQRSCNIFTVRLRTVFSFQFSVFSFQFSVGLLR
jgi:hypothetical protein